MNFTPEAPFWCRPRISRERFGAEMHEVRSPWADRAEALYDLIVEHEHDPAVWLAIGLREHRLLTDPRAVALRLGTNSWTNARSARIPGLAHELVTTDELRSAGIDDREGPYVRYRSVEDSLRDGMERVTDIDYAYWERHAMTIRQVLSIWTESDAVNYIEFVVDNLNEWAEPGVISWWDDPEIVYIPELGGEFGYPKGSRERPAEPDLLILHITAGVDSLGWLNGPNGSSAHYLTWPDGSPRAQLVPEAWAAWTAGNGEYNRRGINVEHEKLRIDSEWTDVEYRGLAWLSARIIRRNPGILVDRSHIIGHNEVPDPVHPGRFGGVGNHVDPGPRFDWDRFIAELRRELDDDEPSIDPNAQEFPTGHWIVNDGDVAMLTFWRERGGVEVCGYPLAGMVLDDDGVYRQICENVLLECWLDGFGLYPGPHYRFGGLGQRYLKCATQRA